MKQLLRDLILCVGVCMSDKPISKRVKTPSILIILQACESGFTMDFNTFVQDGYEVYVEGGGPQGGEKWRLDVVARWKAMGVTSEAVTKYAVENTAFSGDYSSLVKVGSAYELYASVKLVAVDGGLNFVQDSPVGNGSGGLDPALQELFKEPHATMKALAVEVARLSTAANGPQKPKAPDLTKEALDEFNKLEGRPTWMVSQTGL